MAHEHHLDDCHRVRRWRNCEVSHAGQERACGFYPYKGIVGAFVATYLGQALGWYRPDEGAGLIGAVVGAVIVLAIWAAISNRTTRTGL